jgi:hypothetical protein
MLDQGPLRNSNAYPEPFFRIRMLPCLRFCDDPLLTSTIRSSHHLVLGLPLSTLV